MIPIEHIGEGDFLLRFAHFQLDLIIGRYQRQLLFQIGGEQIGPRDGGRIRSGLFQPAKGARAVGWLSNTCKCQFQFGIGIAAIGAPPRRRDSAIFGKGQNVCAQICPRQIVYPDQFVMYFLECLHE